MLTSISNRVNTLLLVFILAVGIGIVAMLASGARGGPLDPPGPPASTLPQVEPRSPIPPVGWDTLSPIAISSPGSYFLTRSLSQIEITISAENVTFDLSGFNLTASTNHTAITVTSGTKRNIVIRNGTLLGGGGTIGISAPTVGRSTFSDLQISGWETGLAIGTGNAVLRVDSHDNSFNGIEVLQGVDFGGSIEDSIFSNNHDIGIFLTGNNVEVRHSIMDTNTSYGVWMGSSWNEVSESRISGNGQYGAVTGGNRNALVRNHIDGNITGSVLNTGAGNIIGPVSPATSTNPAENIGF